MERDDADRGAGWVWLQFVVMAAALGAGFAPPRWPEGAHLALSLTGGALAAGGALVAVWSSVLLGRGFTPFPHPAAGGQLVESGPYRVVRHPIYAGGLAFFTGYALYASVPALVLAAGLGVVWALKAQVEESYLRHHYHAYPAYADRVRFRLLPYLY
jgi:protein-S-isoprenylcysteine O-methyltransferase Ste14